MITIYHYDCPEINHTVKVVFNDFLGIDYQSKFHQKAFTEIVLENGRSLVINDAFFYKFQYTTSYLEKQNIPESVNWLENKFTNCEKIPIIFGNNNILEEKDSLVCNIDIIAGTFFMLSRWEESVVDETDVHDRFKSDNALAVREGFFEKPVVNQYLEFLWNMLKDLGIKQKRKLHNFEIEVSHDVDVPFMFMLVPFKRILRKLAVDVIKRKSLFGALINALKFTSVASGSVKNDPFNTFDKIMDISDRYKLKSTFFFLTGGTSRKHDAGYDPKDKAIRTLISEISKRGHYIGLHGSYNSYKDGRMLESEVATLKEILYSDGLAYENIGIRQHFLRWKTPDTFQIQEDAGIFYDASLGYADKPGFRAGTCYPFNVFNVKTRKELKLIEHPLIVMDCTLTATRYLNLSYDEALKKALEIKKECKKYNGVFTLLWHNTEFAYKDKTRLYEDIIVGE